MEITPTERVAQNIRAELARRCLSQRDVAVALGITQQSVSRRMVGQSPFDVNELAKIAHLLGTDISDLTSGAELAAGAA